MVNRRAWGTLRPPTVGAGAFTPASLPGLIGWYNFDPGNFSQTAGFGGQVVTGMNDLSTANHDLTFSGTGGENNELPYSATGFNGHPCVVFAANLGPSSLVNSSFAMGTGKAYTVYIAGTMGATTNANAGAVVYGLDGDSDYNGTGSAVLVQRNGSAESIGPYRQSTSGVALSLTDDTPSRFGAISRDAGGGSHEFLAVVNGSLGSAAAADFAFVSGGNFVIGTRWLTGATSSDCWAGPMAEIVICNTALDSGDLADLDAYYVDKYGI